jgi:hypothetical protein
MNKFVERSSQLVPLPWRSSLKSGRSLASRLLLVLGLVIGRVTRGWAIVVYQFAWHCLKVYKTQGSKGLALQLRASQVMLLQASAGRSTLTGREFGPGVSRTRSGLPRVIPALHRQAIRRRSAVHLRVWLTLFGLYRVIEFPGVFKVSTITAGPTFGKSVFRRWCSFVPQFHGLMVSRGWRNPEPAELEAKVLLLLKTSPNTTGSSLSSLSGFLSDAYTWVNSPLMPVLEKYCAMTSNLSWVTFIRNCSVTAARRGWVPLQHLGKLGLKLEPGKVRVFAMVDCFTQCLLRPMHDRLFECLRLIPQDGTFDQSKPLKDLVAKYQGRVLWSLDLSAATDRLPVALQEQLVSAFILPELGPVWRSLLVGRAYHYNLDNDHHRDIPRDAGLPLVGHVYYGTGQPMGAYSSWAMLALTHHCIIQMAAMQAGQKGWFDAYAVLGDDVVIADTVVAKEYLRLMKEIGVDISIHKSLVGRDSLEFAKRVLVRGSWVTPIPLREAALASIYVPALVELVHRLADYRPRLSSIAKALGFGYKAISRLSRPVYRLSGRLQGLVLALYAPSTVPYGTEDWVSFFRLVGPEGALDLRYPAVLESARTMVDRVLEAIHRQSEKLSLLGETFMSFYLAEPGKPGTFVVGLGDASPWDEQSLYAKYWEPEQIWADWWISPLVAQASVRLKGAVEAFFKYRDTLRVSTDDLSAINDVYNAWLEVEDVLDLVGRVTDLSHRVPPPRAKHLASKILNLARRVQRIISRGV